jgi:AcrR family transcriptional regulator
MPRSKAANYETQREAILTGAARLFAHRGYLGTSMQDVADACGLSKATLYHYYRDKDEMLVSIADEHVSGLVELVKSVEKDPSVAPARRLETLITRFLLEYADAQNAHRVLTEDVKFLDERHRTLIVDKERVVVRGFAEAIAIREPALKGAHLDKPVAMLLFGMLNWLFTWLKPGGRLSHATLAPIVCELFFKGLTGLAESSGGKKAAAVSAKHRSANALPSPVPKKVRTHSDRRGAGKKQN